MKLIIGSSLWKSQPEMTKPSPEMDSTPRGRKAEGVRVKGYNKQGRKARFKRAMPTNKQETPEGNKPNKRESPFEKSQLAKAMGHAGLVQQQVQVNGPRGTYQAKRWVKPGEEQVSTKPGATAQKPEMKPASGGPKRQIKGLDLRDDGFYYYGGMRLTDNPERAQAYADKVEDFKASTEDGEGKAEDIRVGHRIRIKATARSGEVREHKDRGIVATVTEVLKNGYKIKDDKGRMFTVSHAALEFAKSRQGPLRLVILRKAKLVDPSPMPPKEWMDRTLAGIMAKNPGMDKERAGAIAGAMWYKRMSHKKRAAARHAEGKGYRKEPATKSRLVVFPEVLTKAFREGLTRKMVQVAGAHGTYQAYRWVKVGEDPKKAVHADGQEPAQQPVAGKTPHVQVTPPAIPARTQAPKADEAVTVTKEKTYHDVGEKVGGARKDRWVAIRSGTATLGTGDLDGMDSVTKGQLVSKKNMLPPDYLERMEKLGVAADAGYLIKKLFDTVAPVPTEDTDAARDNYVLAFEQIKTLFRHVKTRADFSKNLSELSDHFFGYMYTPEEKAVVDAHAVHRLAASTERQRAWKDIVARRAEYTKKNGDFDSNRASDDLAAHMAKYAAEHPAPAGSSWEAKTAAQKRAEADPRSFMNTCKALGSRFENALGRGGFNKYLGEANDIKDWGWAHKTKGGTGEEKSDKVKLRWYTEKDDKVERVGGVDVKYTPEQLLKEFKIRGVEYGNWMDEGSSAHHTAMLGLSFNDMSALLGLTPEQVSFKGRLAIAFGARGTGRAMAHYEPGRKVINLTKFNGGGALAHEWFHYIDNVVKEVDTGSASKLSFMTDDAAAGSTSVVSEAVRGSWAAVTRAMMQGTHRDKVSDASKNKYRYVGALDRMLEAGKTPQETMDYISNQTNYRGEPRYNNREQKAYADYIHSKTGTPVRYGQGTSRFASTSRRMGDYWGKPIEMAARAFECYIHDKLVAKGAMNTYLVQKSVSDAKCKEWVATANSVIADESKRVASAPYPDGDERAAINAAFDNLFAALRADNTLQKARLILRRHK